MNCGLDILETPADDCRSIHAVPELDIERIVGEAKMAKLEWVMRRRCNLPEHLREVGQLVL